MNRDVARIAAITIVSVAALAVVGVVSLDDRSHDEAVTALIALAVLLANLFKGEDTGRKVDRLMNGEMDQKIEDGVERVLRKHGLIPGLGRELPYSTENVRDNTEGGA